MYGFMLRDVSREIAAAQRGEDAANFLCAIGLLVYTEALGDHVPGVNRGARNRFEAFFRRLGPEYMTFLRDHPDTYDIFRNGLLHEYRVKRPATIAMLQAPGINVPCGVLYLDSQRLAELEHAAAANDDEVDRRMRELERELRGGRPHPPRYEFIVEKYFHDFVIAADRLHREIVGYRHNLIHMFAPHVLPERT